MTSEAGDPACRDMTRHSDWRSRFDEGGVESAGVIFHEDFPSAQRVPI